MKVWVLEHRSTLYPGYYWTGEGLLFSTSVHDAVQFVRERDARRILGDNLLLNARAAEKELPIGAVGGASEGSEEDECHGRQSDS